MRPIVKHAVTATETAERSAVRQAYEELQNAMQAVAAAEIDRAWGRMKVPSPTQDPRALLMFTGRDAASERVSGAWSDEQGGAGGRVHRGPAGPGEVRPCDSEGNA